MLKGPGGSRMNQWIPRGSESLDLILIFILASTILTIIVIITVSILIMIASCSDAT